MQHPEHGTRQLAQQRTPGVEHVGGDLVRLVKGAQDQRVVGDAPLRARRVLRQRAMRVVGLVAVRQLGDLLAEVRGIGKRRRHRVADEVVDERRAGRPGEAEPTDLQRRGSLRQDRQQGVVGRPLEVDQDVDAELADARRHGHEALATQLLEMLAAVAQPLAQRAVVVAAGRKQRHLEATAVVRLQHLCHQLAGRVLVEVGREIADAQPPLATACDPARQRRIAVCDMQGVVARGLQLFERVVDEHGERKGADLARSVGRQPCDRGTQRIHHLVRGRPSARLALEKRELPARRQVAAAEPESDRRAHALSRFGLHAEVLERHAEAKVRERIVHLQRQRVEEALDGLRMAMTALQRNRQRHVVIVVARHVGGQREQAGDGFLGAAETEQGMRFERVGQPGARLGRAQRARAPDRIAGTARPDQRVRGGERVRGVAVQRRGLLERLRGAWPLLGARVALAGSPVSVGAGLRRQAARRRRVGKLNGHGSKVPGAPRARRQAKREVSQA